MLTGEPIGAADALRWGLINDVVPDGPGNPALYAALALAERVAVNSPLAVQASKRVAYGAERGVVDAESASWKRTSDEFAKILASDDAREGPLAFAERRQPVWTAR